MASAWGGSWGSSWGDSWGATASRPQVVPVVYSSMGRKRREARLARKRKDDEMVLTFVRSFMEKLHAPR